MVESGGSTGLAAEAFQRLRVLGDIIRQEFECDKTPERGVLGLVHHAHPATTQLFSDAVVRDGLTDHALTHTGTGPMLGGNATAVNQEAGGGKGGVSEGGWPTLFRSSYTEAAPPLRS